jgi:hypothetical protein
MASIENQDKIAQNTNNNNGIIERIEKSIFGFNNS